MRLRAKKAKRNSASRHQNGARQPSERRAGRQLLGAKTELRYVLPQNWC